MKSPSLKLKKKFKGKETTDDYVSGGKYYNYNVSKNNCNSQTAALSSQHPALVITYFNNMTNEQLNTDTAKYCLRKQNSDFLHLFPLERFQKYKRLSV